MDENYDDSRSQLRRSVYWMLIVLGVGVMLGRILAVDSVDRIALEEYRVPQLLKDCEARYRAQGLNDRQVAKRLREAEEKLQKDADLCRPFLSGNDRSRWCTVRALVEPEMRVEGAPYAIDKVQDQHNWDTIDMVKNRGHLYSSKPPLFPTLVAGEYWLVYHLTERTCGAPWTLKDQPYTVGRFLLVTTNLIPMIVYFWVLSLLIERFGKTDWGRIFAMAAAVFGTFISTFIVVLNNHVPAAICAVIALWACVRIWFDNEQRLRYFILAGFFAALMVTNELPSAAMAAVLGLAVLWKAPRQAMLGFAPGVVVVAAAFFGTNWIAHQTLNPPYTQRTAGNEWYNYTYQRGGKTEASYWQNPVGVDLGEPNRPLYAFHVLVGHHGIFSLTPIWLLTIAGLGIWLGQREDAGVRLLAAGTLVVSLVAIGFFIMQPQVNRNYGGVTCGLRWLFWLAPFWILAMLPALDAASRKAWTRGLALVCLGVSVLSAAYPTWSPWIHPWLWNYMAYWGWI